MNALFALQVRRGYVGMIRRASVASSKAVLMQPVNALSRLKERVVAHLECINLLHFRLYFSQKTQRQPDLCVSNGGGEAGFLQDPMPLLQVLFRCHRQ